MTNLLSVTLSIKISFTDKAGAWFQQCQPEDRPIGKYLLWHKIDELWLKSSCAKRTPPPPISFLPSSLTCMCGFICFQVSECDRLWFRYLMHCCRTRGVTYCFCRCWSTTLSSTWMESTENTVRTALPCYCTQLLLTPLINYIIN